MGLFKKKISVQDFFQSKINFLLGDDRKQKWDELKTLLDAPKLLEADSERYHSNLTALYIELLSISVVKTQRMEPAVEFAVARHEYFKRFPTIDLLCTSYNQAFGSSPTDGIAAMMQQFEANVAPSGLMSETKQKLYTEFCAVIGQMFQEFKAVKLFGTM